VDVVPFLEASFPTSPPTILDVAGENLLLMGYLVGVFSVSSIEAVGYFNAHRKRSASARIPM
jgi:hypothetical protein